MYIYLLIHRSQFSTSGSSSDVCETLFGKSLMKKEEKLDKRCGGNCTHIKIPGNFTQWIFSSTWFTLMMTSIVPYLVFQEKISFNLNNFKRHSTIYYSVDYQIVFIAFDANRSFNNPLHAQLKWEDTGWKENRHGVLKRWKRLLIQIISGCYGTTSNHECVSLQVYTRYYYP